jgi:hypothetical protein
MIPQAEQGETARQIAELKDDLDAIRRMVGHWTLYDTRPMYEVGDVLDKVIALTADLARLRAEGEALRGALESIARDCGDPVIERRALSALAAPRAEEGTGR